MHYCKSCGTRLPADGRCLVEECRENISTLPAPGEDLERLLDASRPTPIVPINGKSIKTITTLPAPEDGAVIDAFETDIDISDLVCPKCGADFLPGSGFCTECGEARQKRSTTAPYLQAIRPRSMSSAPVPRIDPPEPKRYPDDGKGALAALKPPARERTTYAIVEPRRNASKIARVITSSRPPRKRKTDT